MQTEARITDIIDLANPFSLSQHPHEYTLSSCGIALGPETCLPCSRKRSCTSYLLFRNTLPHTSSFNTHMFIISQCLCLRNLAAAQLGSSGSGSSMRLHSFKGLTGAGGSAPSATHLAVGRKPQFPSQGPLCRVTRDMAAGFLQTEGWKNERATM